MIEAFYKTGNSMDQILILLKYIKPKHFKEAVARLLLRHVETDTTK